MNISLVDADAGWLPRRTQLMTVPDVGDTLTVHGKPHVVIKVESGRKAVGLLGAAPVVTVRRADG